MTNQQGAPEALRTIRRFYRGTDCMAENQAGDWVRYEDHVAALVEAQQPAQSAAADPMDWPLPCDVTVGHGTMCKGVSLRTLVMRMKVLYEMATGNNADEVANRTPEENTALADAFRARIAAAPQPTPTPQADSAPTSVEDAENKQAGFAHSDWSFKAEVLDTSPPSAGEKFLEEPDVQDESGLNKYYSRELVLICIEEALASKAAPPADSQPALWVSPKQFANLTDSPAPFGTYLPARKTSAGKFTMPLFAARANADSVTAPAESDWDVRGHLATSLSFWHRLKNGEDDELVAAFRKWSPPSCTIELDELRKAFRPHDLTQEWTSEHSRNYPGKAARIINAASAAVLTATATPPAQAADSVTAPAGGEVAVPRETLRAWRQWCAQSMSHAIEHEISDFLAAPTPPAQAADSVTAPAGGMVQAPIYRIRTKNTKNVVWTTVPKHEYLAALEAPEIFECELIATQPAQAADSVLEDAARWTTEQEHAIRQGHEIAASDGYFEARQQIDSNDRRKVFQAGFERGWDAARKQGGAT